MKAEALWSLSEVLACLNQFTYCKDEADRQKAADNLKKAEREVKEALSKLTMEELYTLTTRITLFQGAPGPNRHVAGLVTSEIKSR